MTRARNRRAALALAALNLIAVAVCAGPALAGQAVTLRTDLSAAGPSITLGDLFDGAGAVAKTAVGSGAPVGLSAVLDAGEVQRIAHIHGLDWNNERGVRRIIVLSTAAPAPSAESAGATSAAPPRHMVEALTYAHSLNTGDMVAAQDLTFAKVASLQVPSDAPDDAARVIGKVARRPLRAGATVSAQDVAVAQVIKRDDVIEIAYRDGGVNLVLQGRAMTAAGAGEPVTVMNPTSKKTFQAIAIGPDEAVVGPEAERMRQASQIDPAQFASR
jgi:flagellar basal body P-ring formation protein FlgA